MFIILDSDKSTDKQLYTTFEYIVNENEKGIRIDKYISSQLSDYTRSYIQKLIEKDLVYVNDQNIKSNYKLRLNDHIKVNIPLKENDDIEIKAENIPIDVIYEDNDIIIINKEYGMVVHPGPGHYTGTLVNGLLYHYKDNLSTINDDFRPGIVHRLDRDTTGILVVCKNNDAHISIARQLKDHSVKRIYHGIVYNAFNNTEGTIDAPIGRHPVDRKRMSINYDNGKNAITHYKLIENLQDNFAYVECSLETGRTHQIRVHMASISHPILGDKVYGPKNKRFKVKGQALHAKSIGFIHPSTNKYMEFEAPLPEAFNKLLNRLKTN